MIGLSIGFTVMIMVATILPFVLLSICAKRFKIGWLPALTGMGIFLLVDLLRVPLIQLIPFDISASSSLKTSQLILYAFLFGAITGLLVELVRYLLLKFGKWINQDKPTALTIGVGFWSIESILQVGLPVLASFIAMLRVRTSPDMDLPFTEEVIPQLSALWNLPWYTPFLGVLERLISLSMHTALSLLVLRSLNQQKGFWLLVAIVWHGFFEGLSVYLGSLQTNNWLVESILPVILLINLFILSRNGIFELFRKSEEKIAMNSSLDT